MLEQKTAPSDLSFGGTWVVAFGDRPQVLYGDSLFWIAVARNIECKLYFRLGFGTYVQTEEDHINNLEEITTGVISLFPDESIQVGYYF